MTGEGYKWIPPPQCEGTFTWHASSGDTVPSDAVRAGTDLNGDAIYAGRAYHQDDLLPAKVNPTDGCAYITYAGEEHKKTEAEVLCSTHTEWKSFKNGAVPQEAIGIGTTKNGEHLFMGRTEINKYYTPGKIVPSEGCLLVPYNGRELRFSSYEVLVLS